MYLKKKKSPVEEKFCKCLAANFMLLVLFYMVLRNTGYTEKVYSNNVLYIFAF